MRQGALYIPKLCELGIRQKGGLGLAREGKHIAAPDFAAVYTGDIHRRPAAGRKCIDLALVALQTANPPVRPEGWISTLSPMDSAPPESVPVTTAPKPLTTKRGRLASAVPVVCALRQSARTFAAS